MKHQYTSVKFISVGDELIKYNACLKGKEHFTQRISECWQDRNPLQHIVYVKNSNNIYKELLTPIFCLYVIHDKR